MTVSMNQYTLVKKTAYVVVILGLIWVIGDQEFSVFKALEYHEPSARIFRGLLQFNLVIFGAAFSLLVWSKYIKPTITAELLFAPVFPDSTPDVSASSSSSSSSSFYSSVDFIDDEEQDLTEVPPPEEEQAMDAAYASDGEITPPPSKRDNRQQPTLPTASSIAHIALDLLSTILITLFLYTFASSSAKSTGLWPIFARIAAPTFPLLLFVYLSYKLVFPWKKRKAFILVLYTTFSAPWYPVTFRDGFIGDILTSTVRPLQDISFTILYILFGLRSWYTADYQHTSFINSADASVPVMERSWLLHTIVLPMCMVSPLWYRFLQNLRQTNDNRRRWPYLGNALKYFVAAQVAMFGVFQPAHKETWTWLASFVLATLYQVWWDVFMDWSLLERKHGSWQLREKRLYPKKWVYWSIFGINFVLRFCWTLSFLPLRYLDAAGVLTNNFKGDLNAFFGPTIAAAEIIRRTLWGLLRTEWEAVQVGGISILKKLSDDELNDEQKSSLDEEEDDDDVEMIPMNMQGVGDTTIPLSSKAFPSLVDMSSMNPVQVFLELGLYAATFCAIGLVAAAHRGTL